MNIYPLIRTLLFQLNPESAHALTLNTIRLAGGFRPVNSLLRAIYNPELHPVEVFGLKFVNPIGLAAGYDKDGLGWQGLASLGFGHIEVGTVTPKAQTGNPKPRLFRLKEEHALINRMGFPGRGADLVLKEISKPRPKQLVLGVNIGKNRDTPLENAEQDYLYLLNMFAGHVDYITINISSPNTVGLRQLQEKRALISLLSKLNEANLSLVQTSNHRVPILVKLSPDLTDEQLMDAVDAILATQMDGVIATNTTLNRNGVTSTHAKETGGLSGHPLFKQSMEMVQKIHKYSQGKLPIIGVGGISDASSVHKMMDAGAVLVQIYTGLIYEGPDLVKRICREL